MQSEAGKGSAPRKQQDSKSYSENHAKIFGDTSWLDRKKKEEQYRRDSDAALQSLVDESQRLGLYD
jgi:hypothetical protein